MSNARPTADQPGAKLTTFGPAMPKRHKPKPFQASKEVKRLARMTVGAPPTEQVQPDEKRKPPKHRKRELESELL